MSMLQYAQSEYVMFSDQDDFWEKDKVKLTLAKMKELEAKNGNIPLLVHTELAIADGELNITHSRFTVFQGLDPKANTLNRLAAQNNVTGCTAMMNRPLLELVKGIDAKICLCTTGGSPWLQRHSERSALLIPLPSGTASTGTISWGR